MKKNVHFRVVLLENSRKFFILSSSENSNHDRSILKSIVYIKIGFKRSKNEEEERKHAIFVNSRHPLDSRKSSSTGYTLVSSIRKISAKKPHRMVTHDQLIK